MWVVGDEAVVEIGWGVRKGKGRHKNKSDIPFNRKQTSTDFLPCHNSTVARTGRRTE